MFQEKFGKNKCGKSYTNYFIQQYVLCRDYVLSSPESFFCPSMLFFPISMYSTIPLNPFSLIYCFH